MKTTPISFLIALIVLSLAGCQDNPTTRKVENCPDKTILEPGRIFESDSGKFEVLDIQTDLHSPVNKIQADFGKMYILLILKTLSLTAKDGISSVNFILTDADHNIYREPGTWGKIEVMGNISDFEATDGGTIMIYEAEQAVNLFFEVPQGITIEKLRLSYAAPDSML